jgi:hypothetical protein
VRVVHNLIGWIWEKLSAHVAYSMKKGISHKMITCGPSNFEVDGLHLDLLKNPKLGVAHLSST